MRAALCYCGQHCVIIGKSGRRRADEANAHEAMHAWSGRFVVGAHRRRRAVASAILSPRPVKVVVPFAAGGPLDLVGRAVFDRLSAKLKQTFVMENRTGAGGNIGTDAVAKAAPDGYTLLFVLSGTLTANPAMYRSCRSTWSGICGRSRCWSPAAR